MTSISEKSTLSSTLNSNSNISNNSNVINIKNVNKANNNNIIDEKIITSLEGLLYYIGNFQKNYFGARNCLLLVNKIFERDFNPEVDIYIKLFKTIDIKYIKQMNLTKFSIINNCINQKLCFNLINIYVNGYNEKKQIKILNDLNADSNFINKFLDNNLIDSSLYNSFNLE